MPGEAELRLRERLARLKSLPLLGGARLSGEVERLERQLERLAAAPAATADEIWRSVELARHPDRPYTLDYVGRLLEDFVELHGDRNRADDAAIVGGIGRFGARTVALLGQQKDATSASAPSATSAWPTPRATGRRCGSWSCQTATASR